MKGLESASHRTNREGEARLEHLQNKVAVVTGAASGIGLGITRALIAEGVHVAMLDVEEQALTAALAGIGDTNVDV